MFALWRGDLLALIAGALLPLAFAPYDLYPLAITSLLILFLLWLDSSVRRAMWRGLLFGIGMFGVGVSWVFISMYHYGQVSLALSLFITAMFVLVMSLFIAFAAGAAVKIRNRYGAKPTVALLWIFPAVWVLFEWIRGWMFTGFPWLSVGYSQVEAPLGGLASLLGVYGVSFSVAITASLLAIVLYSIHVGGRSRHIVGLALLWCAGFLFSQVNWVSPAGEPMRVTLLQGNIPQELKWLPSMRAPTIDLYAQMTRENWESDLVIWPETALPAFFHESTNFLALMNEEAQQNNTDILLGLVYLDRVTREYYNTMMSLGSETGFYHKRHLVPFTEYLPLKEWLSSVINIIQVPMSDFSAGSHDQPPLLMAGQKVGISICFEDAFGEEVIMKLPEATLLVNVSNDAWFADSSAPHQHLQMARMRAMESGRPMLRATNTGISAIIDHRGVFQSRAPQFEEAALSSDVVPMQGATPYVLVGNLGILALLLASLLLPLLRRS